MSASRSSVAHNYFRSSLRNLFTAFLEAKTQLWKLMSAISGCCTGSSGGPLHPPPENSKRYRLAMNMKPIRTIFDPKKVINKNSEISNVTSPISIPRGSSTKRLY